MIPHITQTDIMAKEPCQSPNPQKLSQSPHAMQNIDNNVDIIILKHMVINFNN